MWTRATKDVRKLEKRTAPSPKPKADGAARVRQPSPQAAPPSLSPALSKRSAAAQDAQRDSVFRAGDPQTESKARRGRITVERILDLHGLTQDAAWSRLRRFFQTAVDDGVRCVLVVTGKGRGATARSSDREIRPRGVLRARFLDWIEEEPLRSFVARAAKAAPRHGGDGAFYVFLKKKR